MRASTIELIGVLFLTAQIHVSAGAQEQLHGTWQLVEVEVPRMELSNPRGISTLKEHYTPEGRLYFIPPSQALNEGTPWATVKIEGTKRTIRIGDRGPYVATISFPDRDSLAVEQPSGDIWHYRRLKGDDAPSRKIEPLSVERTGMRGADKALPVQYDGSDYSTLPLERRIIGAWEIIKYCNVSRTEAPPYGFFNDVWTFDGGNVAMSMRVTPGKADRHKLPYQLREHVLEFDVNAGSPQRMGVSFNSWGHMVLEVEGRTIFLKLIDKKPTGQRALPPLKIVLLKLQGEECDP